MFLQNKEARKARTFLTVAETIARGRCAINCANFLVVSRRGLISQ